MKKPALKILFQGLIFLTLAPYLLIWRVATDWLCVIWGYVVVFVLHGGYAFHIGRCGTREDFLLKQGYTWVVDADLQSYFDTINHNNLMKLLEEKISDKPLLNLIQKFLKQNIMDGIKEWKPTAGTPQGAVLSPCWQIYTCTQWMLC